MDNRKDMSSPKEAGVQTTNENECPLHAYSSAKQGLFKRMEALQTHFNQAMKRCAYIRRSGGDKQLVQQTEEDLTLLYQLMWQLYSARKDLKRRFPVESSADESCQLSFRKISEELSFLPETYLEYYQRTQLFVDNRDVSEIVF